MGVRIVHDPKAGLAALFCSTSDFAFGPIFNDREGKDAEQRAQAFLRWLDTYFPPEDDLNALGRLRWRHDPRELTDIGKERAYAAWLKQEAQQYQLEREAEEAA